MNGSSRLKTAIIILVGLAFVIGLIWLVVSSSPQVPEPAQPEPVVEAGPTEAERYQQQIARDRRAVQVAWDRFAGQIRCGRRQALRFELDQGDTFRSIVLRSTDALFLPQVSVSLSGERATVSTALNPRTVEFYIESLRIGERTDFINNKCLHWRPLSAELRQAKLDDDKLRCQSEWQRQGDRWQLISLDCPVVGQHQPQATDCSIIEQLSDARPNNEAIRAGLASFKERYVKTCGDQVLVRLNRNQGFSERVSLDYRGTEVEGFTQLGAQSADQQQVVLGVGRRAVGQLFPSWELVPVIRQLNQHYRITRKINKIVVDNREWRLTDLRNLSCPL